MSHTSRSTSGIYDTLTTAWNNAEEKLRRLKCTVEVFVEQCGNDSQEGIGLAKYNGKWRICHRSEDLKIKLIIECTVRIKVDSTFLIERLYNAVMKEVDNLEPEILGAISRLERFNNAGKEAGDE